MIHNQKPLPIFLFRFGFESPAQQRSNNARGWDDEDTRAVFIESGDADQAMSWGREIAEAFVQRLWAVEGEPAPSWKQAQFAHWLEANPDEIAKAKAVGVPSVRPGEHPLL